MNPRLWTKETMKRSRKHDKIKNRKIVFLKKKFLTPLSRIFNQLKLNCSIMFRSYLEFVVYLFERKKICAEIFGKEPERNLEEEEIVKGNENCLSATLSKVHGVPLYKVQGVPLNTKHQARYMVSHYIRYKVSH